MDPEGGTDTLPVGEVAPPGADTDVVTVPEAPGGTPDAVARDPDCANELD